MYKLRPYQLESVDKTLQHFRREKSPALIVLPTGAGKSLVIAELARLARGRVLVLAHVKELVEQNHEKYESMGLSAGIYSAGLNRKNSEEKVIFGSIQSVARAEESFFLGFTLLIIDECHRVSMDEDTQYLEVINKLNSYNDSLCILGLTATPYRLGLGWTYQYHLPKKLIRTREKRFFHKCLFELDLKYMIDNGYLTPPLVIDAPVASYDFSSLLLQGNRFVQAEIEKLLKDQKRITPVIVKNIIDVSAERKGVMIFTSSVSHAEEILKLLPPFVSAMVIGDTASDERVEIIEAFKRQELKFLVNVSVLTTGFDAPHVDVIALLRPTESISLFQQIVGRGLRLFPGKEDCLVLDYTGQGHSLYAPEIEENKKHKDSVLVQVPCPVCETLNDFWGLLDSEGNLVEHFGRKCGGFTSLESNGELIECGFRFRFKLCDSCGCEQDISARQCQECKNILIDNDKKLKEAMALKDAHVMRVEEMQFTKAVDHKFQTRLEVRYFDVDGESLSESFFLNTVDDRKAFYHNFVRFHLRLPGAPESSPEIYKIEDVLRKQSLFRIPQYIIARKKKKDWEIREKVFQ